MTKFELYFFPDAYSSEIEKLAGRLILLYGQIDRLLIGLIRKASNPTVSLKDAIGIARGNRGGRGMTLGDWQSWFEKRAPKFGIESERIKTVLIFLELIKPIRDRLVHDSLLQNQRGGLEWKSNHSLVRKHQSFDIGELQKALDLFFEFKKYTDL